VNGTDEARSDRYRPLIERQDGGLRPEHPETSAPRFLGK